MYLKEHKKGKFGTEISGYLANLQINKAISNICFISSDYDCLTIGEIIKASGYDPKSILNRRLLITIEDET
jgi:AraC-like DNA-binding protein